MDQLGRVVMDTGSPIHVLIADDQPPVRSALRLLLKYALGVSAVDEAENGSVTLRLAAVVRPNVVLPYGELPACDGMAPLVSGLHAAQPDLMVIALSGKPEARHAALEAGADAFVSKGEPPDRLLEALSVAQVASNQLAAV